MKKVKKLGRVKKSPRGFEYIEFKDRYDTACSLQISSLADCAEPGLSAVWLGTEDLNPQVMAKDAASVGVETDQQNGWVPFPIPDKVNLSARMHLSRNQVASLIWHLQQWLDTGSFK